MKRIVVPTDFSPTAERAFQYALDIAAKSGAAVILYHVYEPVESEFIDNVTKRRLYNEQMESDLMKQLQRLTHKFVPADFSVPVSTILGRAPVVDNILGFAEHNQIDLVVMGTQGAGGLKRALVGTIASRIIKQADCPVLLIPEKFDWKLPAQIVYATDCMAPDRTAFNLVLSLAKLYEAKITVVHMIHGDAGETNLDQESGFFEKYAHALQQDYSDFTISFELVKTVSMVDAMERLHQELPYDMVVMVRREKHFLQRFFVESFTKNMLYTTSQPLLVIPEDF
ncbi:universal stress protein [Flavihumibacter stibioxidans]|uniref:UspA domain-containing protein n=1 Tax=Flavihumibacter stibioxidans TaxID=1834163 RepID=A0ABR7MA62_9BACT|nr:universal stress protein [Flavihumibacter stibioxidans]MBC6491409.1 hypothetical protein [Flavihumibacter stibioxidans]